MSVAQALAMKLFLQHPGQAAELMTTLRHTHARSLCLAVTEFADRTFGRVGWRPQDDPQRPCMTAVARSGATIFVEPPPAPILFPFVRGGVL